MPELVQQLVYDTKDVSLWPFAPELAICATIVVMLLARLFNVLRRVDAFYLALGGSLVALCLAAPWTYLASTSGIERTEIFTGMLVWDPFSVFVRSFLFAFAAMFVLFTRLSGMPDREDATDFYTLFLGGTLGMCLMASANHLLMVFLAVEMASVPSYVLAGMLRRPRSSEAALKYAVYGAGAAGVMVYGISLLVGILHTAHLPTLAAQLAGMLHSGQLSVVSTESMVLALGGLMIMVGLAFKLSAVPFHFWCPDVFEGASAEIGAFLSVASKGAALALLLRVALGVAVVPEGYSAQVAMNQPDAAVADSTAPGQLGLLNLADNPSEAVLEAAPAESSTDDESEDEQANATTIVTLTPEQTQDALAPIRGFVAMLVAFLAAITCTFGNLAAYAQTNMKRLLAYSTIAHAGYMMMAVPPALVLAGYNPAAGQAAVGALTLYLAIYLFMNLGAFAVVAFLRNQIGSEEIADYAGLVRQCPGVVVCLAIMMFSLVGLPPLAGFIGKFAVFASLVDGYQASAVAGQAATYLIVLLIVGGINTAISLFYYLRVVKVMTIDPEPEDRTPITFPLVSLSGAYIALVTAPIVLLIISWNWINEVTRAAAEHLM